MHVIDIVYKPRRIKLSLKETEQAALKDFMIEKMIYKKRRNQQKEGATITYS